MTSRDVTSTTAARSEAGAKVVRLVPRRGTPGSVPDEAAAAPRARGGVRTIAVTSGKGGVGKTCVTVNLAVALARRGRRVLLIDADLGLANVDTVLGLHPRATLRQVLSGERAIADVVLDGPAGIRIVPAASGFEEMGRLPGAQLLALLEQVDGLARDFDVALIDTGAGISPAVLCFGLAADEKLIVTTPEPTALTDAYALMKIFANHYGERCLDVVVNMARSRGEAARTFSHLSRVSERFLGFAPRDRGALPLDHEVPAAIRRQQAVLELAPRAPISLAFAALAARLDGAPPAVQRPDSKPIAETV
jgi:flagellar biosynthesis protein FlhG